MQKALCPGYGSGGSSPEVMKENYADGDLHRIYIGEVVDILRKTET